MRNLFLSSLVLLVSCYCGAAVILVPDGYPTIGAAITASSINDVLCPPPKPIEPFGDGDVDIVDFAAFAANWLEGTQ